MAFARVRCSSNSSFSGTDATCCQRCDCILVLPSGRPVESRRVTQPPRPSTVSASSSPNRRSARSFSSAVTSETPQDRPETRRPRYPGPAESRSIGTGDSRRPLLRTLDEARDRTLELACRIEILTPIAAQRSEPEAPDLTETAVEIAEVFASWDLLRVSDRQKIARTFVEAVHVERVGMGAARCTTIDLLLPQAPPPRPGLSQRGGFHERSPAATSIRIEVPE